MKVSITCGRVMAGVEHDLRRLFFLSMTVRSHGRWLKIPFLSAQLEPECGGGLVPLGDPNRLFLNVWEALAAWLVS